MYYSCCATIQQMIDLRSKVRRRLLRYYFTNPEARLYLRELAQILSVDPANLSRELARLERHGLFLSQRRGIEKYYRLNSDYPLYAEVKGIVTKTLGVVPLLKQALERMPGIRQAYLYGSFARNQQDAASDIDVLIVGQPSAERLAARISKLERQLGREINYLVLSPDELASRRRKRDPLLADIWSHKKIELVTAA